MHSERWLELVFAGRNKEYGAYELRQHNAITTLKALMFGSVLIIAGVTAPFLYSRFLSSNEIVHDLPPLDGFKITEYNVPKIKKSEPEKLIKRETVKIPTQKFVPLKVVPAPEVVDEMPTLAELENSVVGQETIKAAPTTGVQNTIDITSSGNGRASVTKPTSDEPVNLEMLEKYPEFPGGMAAFAKYIGRNLRYPSMARENEISGRVFVSFVIERNGSLSNIKILRGIGGGCDEEALRVLKNSPSWAAGMQNGQKVRVAYTMPIFFQLAN